jgi:hypothetical protein
MVEPIMFFALGFLVASLLALLILPLVHARAVRLAGRRLWVEIPWSMAEMRADKDLLRARFAVSVRRFEMGIEQLKERLARQLVELGRKSDEINRLKVELQEKSVTICALEARNGAVANQIPDGPAVAAAPRMDRRSLTDALAELSKLNPELDASPLAASPQVTPVGQTRSESNVHFLLRPRDRQAAIVHPARPDGASELAVGEAQGS